MSTYNNTGGILGTAGTLTLEEIRVQIRDAARHLAALERQYKDNPTSALEVEMAQVRQQMKVLEDMGKSRQAGAPAPSGGSRRILWLVLAAVALYLIYRYLKSRGK